MTRRNIQRIVLIEPDDVLAEVTAFRLELLGYRVQIVARADAALRACSDDPPDLIIMDLMLDGQPATGLIEALSSQELTSSIPIMVLSLDADLDRVAAVHKAGAADFLVVPYQPDVLQEKVARLLERRAAAEESYRIRLTAH